MTDTKNDEKSNHPEKDHNKSLRRKWKRINFGDSTKEGIRIDSENEVDRDMLKTLEQMACDIHETYFRWERNSKSTEEMKEPVHFILYSLARTASMNAKVARSMDRLTHSLKIWTIVIAFLTFLMVLKELPILVKYFCAIIGI
jgi:hypothetical protein